MHTTAPLSSTSPGASSSVLPLSSAVATTVTTEMYQPRTICGPLFVTTSFFRGFVKTAPKSRTREFFSVLTLVIASLGCSGRAKRSPTRYCTVQELICYHSRFPLFCQIKTSPKPFGWSSSNHFLPQIVNQHLLKFHHS